VTNDHPFDKKKAIQDYIADGERASHAICNHFAAHIRRLADPEIRAKNPVKAILRAQTANIIKAYGSALADVGRFYNMGIPFELEYGESDVDLQAFGAAVDASFKRLGIKKPDDFDAVDGSHAEVVFVYLTDIRVPEEERKAHPIAKFTTVRLPVPMPASSSPDIPAIVKKYRSQEGDLGGTEFRKKTGSMLNLGIMEAGFLIPQYVRPRPRFCSMIPRMDDPVHGPCSMVGFMYEIEPGIVTGTNYTVFNNALALGAKIDEAIRRFH
jgi:hypothetical protein